MPSRTRLKKGAAITAILITTVGAFEGLRLAAYRDPVGIPTICFGETKGVRMGQKKTRAECDAMLLNSLIEHEQGMMRCLPAGLPDKVHGAMVSVTYNIGVGAFCKSSMSRLARAGDLRGACNALLKWDKAGGRRLPGLTRRRREERAMCLAGL
jgi:lysozyme